MINLILHRGKGSNLLLNGGLYQYSCGKKQKSYNSGQPCADPESFVRGGPTLSLFFLVDEGKEDPNTTISGPSSAQQ